MDIRDFNDINALTQRLINGEEKYTDLDQYKSLYQEKIVEARHITEQAIKALNQFGSR